MTTVMEVVGKRGSDKATGASYEDHGEVPSMKIVTVDRYRGQASVPVEVKNSKLTSLLGKSIPQRDRW